MDVAGRYESRNGPHPPWCFPEADLLPLSERQTEIDSWLTRAMETADAEGDAAASRIALISDWTFPLPVVLCPCEESNLNKKKTLCG